MNLRPTRTYIRDRNDWIEGDNSRLWPDVTKEEREDANASIDAAMKDRSHMKTSKKDGTHCPCCGKYISPESGFGFREVPDDESSPILVACDERCADAAIASTSADRPDASILNPTKP
jgi:hypothetical protein